MDWTICPSFGGDAPPGIGEAPAPGYTHTAPHSAAQQVILPILIDNWEGLFTIMPVLWRFSELSVSVMALTDRPLMIDHPRPS